MARVSMGTVWDRTTEFLGDRAGPVLALAGLAILVPMSIAAALRPLGEGAGAGTRLALGLVSLACSLTQLWGQLAIVATALDPVADRRAATATAGRRLPAAVGVLLVLLVVLVVLMTPLGIMVAMSGVDLNQLVAGQPVRIGTEFGLSASLYTLGVSVLLLWAMARLIVLTPVVVAERLGLGAIPRAAALTRGLALRIVGVIVLFGVVLTVSRLATETVFGSVLRLVAPGTGSPLDLAAVLTSVATGAVVTGFTVLANVFTAKLFLASRSTRDPAAAGS